MNHEKTNHSSELASEETEYDSETFFQKISFPAFLSFELFLIIFFLPEIFLFFGYDFFELLGIR